MRCQGTPRYCNLCKSEWITGKPPEDNSARLQKRGNLTKKKVELPKKYKRYSQGNSPHGISFVEEGQDKEQKRDRIVVVNYLSWNMKTTSHCWKIQTTQNTWFFSNALGADTVIRELQKKIFWVTRKGLSNVGVPQKNIFKWLPLCLPSLLVFLLLSIINNFNVL